MIISKRFMTKTRCHTNATKSKVEKLVLHSLGVAQPNAHVLINSWNNIEAGVSIHAFVMDNQVIQTLPWDYKGWHVDKGNKGSYNNCAIGVEICEPSGHKYNGGTMVGYDIKKNATYFEKVYNNAVELFAYLCEEFKLDPIKDILCHSEVYQLGYGSNHADVMHWFPKHGKTMDTFRSDVKSKLAKSTVPVKPITPKSSKEDIIWAQEQYNKLLPVIPNIIPLKTNGEYDAQTRIAALIYLDMLGWGKGMETSGKCIGMNTIKALASGRKK